MIESTLQTTSGPITISALTTHIVALFETDELLRDVWVTGEVSSWKKAASGHIYFSLKDSGANISAVMWRNSALNHSWLPKTGDQILAHGYIGVYPERGTYQLYINRVQPAGRGQLYAQFEALKRKLIADGLFDAERKRPIEQFPRRVGIITSANAAALRDILRVFSNRWSLIDIIVFPALVQGTEAPRQIVDALQAANRYSHKYEPIDTLILARGGGSIEDLWAFNDEQVAYAIAQSNLPIVAGIGHETDFTIADFVADLRTPTPSAAAAAVVPDQAEVIEQLRATQIGLAQSASLFIQEQRQRLLQYQMRLKRTHPQRQIDLRRQQIIDRERWLNQRMDNVLSQARTQLNSANLRLAALNPQAVLERGYSIVQDAEGHVIKSPSVLKEGDKLMVQAASGQYNVSVLENPNIITSQNHK